MVTCLVLFHPTVPALSVFASFWRFYAQTEVPNRRLQQYCHRTSGSYGNNRDTVGIETGARCHRWRQLKALVSSQGLPEAHGEVLADE